MGGAELLIAIAHILTTEADLTEALRLVVREVVRFVGAETGAAYRVDPERRLLVPVAAYRVPHHALSILTSALLPIDEQGFRESVFAGATITSSDDVQNDPRFARDVAERTGFVPNALMAAPLLDGERVLGVLQVLDRPQGTKFTLREMELLGLFANQAAIALDLLSSARQAREVLAEQAEDLGVVARLAASVDVLEGWRREAALRLLGELERLLS